LVQVNVGLIDYSGPGEPLLPLAERQANNMRQHAEVNHYPRLICSLDFM
jgi:hypothetical protein